MEPRSIADQTEAQELRNSGLFRDALSVLGRLPKDLAGRAPAQVLRAELLEKVGKADEARPIIQRLLALKTLSLSDRSLCEFVLARMELERGAIENGISNLNRAIASATRAGDFWRACDAQLKLLLVLSDGAGTDATGPLLAEVRANAARTGDPRVLACVHVYFAQIEALRGSIKTSRRHIKLAFELLQTAPNTWLETIIANIELALCVMGSEFDSAEIHAHRGRELSERCGGAIEYAVNQANAGYLWRVLGRLDEAVECFERAMRLFVPGSENFNGAVDSLARVRLAQGRFEECQSLLAEIDRDLSPKSRAGYVFRHVQPTKAQLYIRTGDLKQAMNSIEHTLRLAERADDKLLNVLANLGKAEIFLESLLFNDASHIVENVAASLSNHSAEVYAKFEKILGRAGVLQKSDTARDHFARADRVYVALNHREGLADLHDCHEYVSAISRHDTNTSCVASSVLHSTVAILSFPKHPEFIAREVVAILAATKAVDAVSAVARSSTGEEQTLTEVLKNQSSTFKERRILVGEAAGRTIDVKVKSEADLSSLATVLAAANLIARAAELKAAREDRNERATIWPVEDLPASVGSNAIISGHMRELMMYAQRVARTNVNVLITGESGTGKEILARAIHDFSGRAQKPFVPFNCAAVPRDLLESQLFGHRRGSFTGAERDQLGLIRAAAGGTLFLDEVGEMSPDLQPKLLRFLESGEISPLGEPSPLTVDVRVVAATNSNLEDAVRDGKFREDLYYRLNVVRLSIRPLRERRDEIPGMVNQFVARAARDYRKGHLEIAEETMERLLLFRWPGNVRQLQNEIRRLVALAEPNSTIEPHAISPDILGALPYWRHPSGNGREIAVPLQDKLLPTLSRIEYEMIKAALREHRGKLEPAAKALGISRKGLYLKRQRLGL